MKSLHFPQLHNKNKDARLISWLRLIRTENVGPVTFHQLLETYGSADKALEALPDLAAKGGRKAPLRTPPESAVKKEIDKLHKLGGNFITAADEAYPLALSALHDAPPVIATLGNLALLQEPSLAIIGARNASLNGKKFAQKLARDLGQSGHIITSGLARGIDTAAHEGALATGTIAVLAGGVDVIYPEENTNLYKNIKETGLIVSEFPMGTKPMAQHFPRRNRIVSGLSKGVVVVEATLKSGSLITARMAGDQGRDVFAVPGHPADPRASGPNALIRDGAVLVRSAEDILEHLQSFSGCALHDSASNENANFIAPPGAAPQITAAMRTQLLENLSYHAIGIDELIRTCHFSIGTMQTLLLELELAGRIKRLPGNAVALIEQEEE